MAPEYSMCSLHGMISPRSKPYLARTIVRPILRKRTGQRSPLYLRDCGGLSPLVIGRLRVRARRAHPPAPFSQPSDCGGNTGSLAQAPPPAATRRVKAGESCPGAPYPSDSPQGHIVNQCFPSGLQVSLLTNPPISAGSPSMVCRRFSTWSQTPSTLM